MTLIELLVGMVIGLLAILVMAQVGSVYEAQKRSTTSGSDAQVNAALALYTLQRDIQMSGYGLTSAPGAMGCAIKGTRAATTTPVVQAAATLDMTLAPILITDGASGAPDTITVIMSSSPNYSLPIAIGSQHLRGETEFMLKPQVNMGNSKGDLMMAVPPVIDSTHWCSVFNISADPSTTGDRIVHETGADGPWNAELATKVFPGTDASDVSYDIGSYLINLGRLSAREYSISSDQTLQVVPVVTDAAVGSTEALFSNVVNLQAVYGKDTNGDLVADTWEVKQPTNPAEWGQVVAVRLAVVTRSAQYEKGFPPGTPVTAAQPTWKPDGTTATTLKVDGPTDWQQYRYKVYEMTVPLRNVLWHSR